MKYLFTFLSLVILTYTAAAQTTGSAMPNAIFYNRNSTTFPTYTIPTGKQSLIIFFDATCEHCQRVIAEIGKRKKELTKVNIYLVSQDEYRSIDYFMTNFGKELLPLKNVTVVQDRDHVFIMAFHPKQYPALYLYGPDKKLVFNSSNEKEVPKFFKLINR
jgi:hypothetical protein